MLLYVKPGSGRYTGALARLSPTVSLYTEYFRTPICKNVTQVPTAGMCDSGSKGQARGFYISP